ncbi:MAG TPA: DinB family protein [Pyrinomonadaceae bacterium]|nr:DinB family protein [Pyrinomonadaceae bacterium]
MSTKVTTTAADAGANTSAGELDSLLGELASIARDARSEFGGLSPRQVNWKADEKQWSVGQCFAHLMKTNGAYFPKLEALARGERRGTLWERLSPLSGFLGRTVLKFVAPESPRKAKARPGFTPSDSEVEADVIEQFVGQQTRLAELMRANRGLDPERVIVTSPIAGFVTYSLLDAYRIIVAHERRHFAQARRVTEAEGFPRS